MRAYPDTAAQVSARTGRGGKIRPGPGAGFTLIEVMIALAVLGIALVTAVRNQAEGIDALSEARSRTAASWLAQAKMAELESAGFGAETTVKGTFEEEPFGKEYARFRWEARVLTVPAVELVRKVRVRVIWDEGPLERFVELEGFFKPRP